MRDRSLGDGAYFAPGDYVGLGPRILILLIDALVLIALLGSLAYSWIEFVSDFNQRFVIVAIFTIWLYLVPLKRSRVRTLGYNLLGVRLVTLQNQVPTFFIMTVRELMWIFGPGNFLIDLVWCGIDDDRQTMRDRLTGVCLIKKGAEPIGVGEIHFAYFNAFGYTLAYPRVIHPKRTSDG